MTVKFTKIQTGRTPEIGAYVDNVLVTWRRRQGVSMWRCGEHGEGLCDHSEAVEAILPDPLIDRLEHHENRNSNQEAL